MSQTELQGYICQIESSVDGNMYYSLISVLCMYLSI